MKQDIKTIHIKRGKFLIAAFINEAKGMVVAKILSCPYAQFTEGATILGRTKLHPDDTFDIKTGVRIAVERAIRHYYGTVCAKLEKIKHSLNDDVIDFYLVFNDKKKHTS